MPDNLTAAQRSLCMSRSTSKNTTLERQFFASLDALGITYTRHVRALPGTPDAVSEASQVAVFIDGDFWHGWRFPTWRANLSPYWRAKIDANRARDIRNVQRLRRMGWRVIRIWEHNVTRDSDAAAAKVAHLIRSCRRPISSLHRTAQ